MRDLKELAFSGRPRAKLKKTDFSVTIFRGLVSLLFWRYDKFDKRA